MKKGIITHILFFLSFFIIVSVFKGMLDINYLPFWVGAIIGVILPDIDYLLHIYIFNPNSQTSKQASNLFAEGKTVDGLNTVSKINPADNFLLHNANLQLAFTVFAFWALTSSNNILGRGLVLAFLLHLVVDQISALVEKKDYDFWFKGFVFKLKDKEKKLYFAANAVFLLILGLFF